MKTLSQTIGAAARRARHRLGLTQVDMAERAGLSAEFYARLERGRALPSVPAFVRLAAALELRADELLGLSGQGADVPSGLGRARPAGDAAIDSPALRRLARRLRTLPAAAFPVVTLIVKELERIAEAGAAGEEEKEECDDD